MYGVYFSGNDRVHDWVVAFLESYREFNPNLPLRLIPFNDECEKIFSLADKYRFEIHQDPSFALLEGIGEQLELGITPSGPHWFRRFSSFWGPFDTFFYFDARTLVLTDLIPILERLEKGRFDLFHYDCALDQVYNPSPLREKLLLNGGARGFNSGRWAAKKGIFDLSELLRYGNECSSMREHLNARNTDQFFLNYCCDVGEKNVASFAEVMGGMCSSGWCRQTGSVYRDGACFRRWDHGGSDHKKQVPLLHWAGIPLSCSMPEAELFFWFRDRSLTAPKRLWRGVKRVVPRKMGQYFSWFKKQRFINQTWHCFRRG
jgi:hypothetical protein